MKVMIVDDSSSMRLLVKRTLKQAGFTGLDICEAENGSEALEAMDSERPDVILCDWNMPVMSGRRFAEVLKANQRLSHVKLIPLVENSVVSSSFLNFLTSA